MSMTWSQLVSSARALPEVEESIWYRTPSLAVRRKHFVRLKEDGETVVFLVSSIDEQEFLIGSQPSVYFVTDHYRSHAAVLARLAMLDPTEAKKRLEEAWRVKAPKTLVRSFDATRG